MYSEEIMMEFPYEDLSLFNGDLLLEDVDQTPAVAPLGLKDEIVFSNAVDTPKISVQITLAHPQNGSQQFSLQELLATTPSPTQDLPDPFGQTSAWFDTKTDLEELLCGIAQPQTSRQQFENVPAIRVQQYESASTQDIFSADNRESLEAMHTLLSDSEPLTQSHCFEAPENEDYVVYMPEAVNEPTEEAMDILDEIAEEQLEQLLSGGPYFDHVDTAALLDNPVLSPVSADDVESLLSSNPCSPTDQSSLYNSFTDVSSSNLETIDMESLSGSSSIVRPVREKARAAPYTLSSPSSSASSSAASSPRKMKVDKKERKKEQNRSAALRYREKKRGEQDTVQQEIDELQDRNTSLKGQVDSLSKEIQYLKNLMAEVQNAKAKMKKEKSGGAS